MIPGPTELILILLIVVMLFGAKKIPEIMSGLGKGIKTFKKAMEGEDDSETLPPPLRNLRRLRPLPSKEARAQVYLKRRSNPNSFPPVRYKHVRRYEI